MLNNREIVLFAWIFEDFDVCLQQNLFFYTKYEDYYT
jgi:hypothetical protein